MYFINLRHKVIINDGSCLTYQAEYDLGVGVCMKKLFGSALNQMCDKGISLKANDLALQEYNCSC